MTMPYMNETPCQHGNYACPLCDAAWTPGQGAIDAGPERTRSHAAQDGSTGESPLTGLNSHSERNTMDPAVMNLQKTGYYVHYADGTSYHDEYGHGWFSKKVARDVARAIQGMYFDGNKTSLKKVVIGYVGGEV